MKTLKPIRDLNRTRSPKRTVLIIDDHVVVRKGLICLIDQEQDLTVCGESGDATTAFDAISRLNPDVVLVDISLPGTSGIEFIKNGKACHPDLPIVVFSMHDESLYAERTLRAGALGYVMKGVGGEEITTALRKALQGKIHTSDRINATLMERFLGRRKLENETPASVLSDRELEIFELIGNGKSSREISASLKISIKTVESHRLHIKEKLGLRTGMDLVRRAVNHVENGMAA